MSCTTVKRIAIVVCNLDSFFAVRSNLTTMISTLVSWEIRSALDEYC